MSQFRYSVNGLLLAIAVIDLSLVVLTSLLPGNSDDIVARGGLSTCTLLFAALCGIMGESASRVLVLSARLYAWGLGCLVLGNMFDLHELIRWALAAAGAAFAIQSLIPPFPQLGSTSQVHREGSVVGHGQQWHRP